jgi:hypothetical protein
MRAFMETCYNGAMSELLEIEKRVNDLIKDWPGKPTARVEANGKIDLHYQLHFHVIENEAFLKEPVAPLHFARFFKSEVAKMLQDIKTAQPDYQVETAFGSPLRGPSPFSDAMFRSRLMAPTPETPPPAAL